MSSPSAAAAIADAFSDLDAQRALISRCTLLWKDLSDHFAALENDLALKSQSLASKLRSLDSSTDLSLAALRRREYSIDASVGDLMDKLEKTRDSALKSVAEPDPDEKGGFPVEKLRSLVKRMDSEGFWGVVVAGRKKVEACREEMGSVLMDCVDPARFVMDLVSRVFPVDDKDGKEGVNDYGWACVLILEAVVSVLADPVLRAERVLVTPSAKERARGMAKRWKVEFEKRRGVETAKPPDVHTFLQHVVTFDIVDGEDKELYRRLVLSSSWRRQMPRLALALGLGDIMIDIIDDLITRGQQLDAVNFAYEANLVDKYPPVPLLKSYLEDSKKAATSIIVDRSNSGRATNLAGRKEQSALRAVIKCIEDHKLEFEFPLDSLQKRLEQLEKFKAEKVEKKRPATVPANKRTRANSGGPMPPAKAGRLINHSHVPSFSSPPAYIRSPTMHSPYHAAVPAYAYERPGVGGMYGSQSPPAIRDPYPYRHDELTVTPAGMSYPGTPVSYPVYAGYGNGFAPGYQQAYYR